MTNRFDRREPDMANTYGMLDMEYDWDNPDTWGDTDSVWREIESAERHGEMHAEWVADEAYDEAVAEGDDDYDDYDDE